MSILNLLERATAWLWDPRPRVRVRVRVSQRPRSWLGLVVRARVSVRVHG